MLGIVVTSISYMGFAFLTGAANLRYATGIAPPNATELPADELMKIVGRPGPCEISDCPYGLFNDVNVSHGHFREVKFMALQTKGVQ